MKSLPLGTILQNRYRITKTLGKGGFGLTYLAEDQARFNELCVLKEFTPGNMGADILKKAEELFQREASVLYQIQHPQIPQFRATFEEDKRLFLVQDYAEGKTYAQLLSERQKESKTFCEAEVVEFLQQILPILEHIHSKGIIHRDISPDNIILRDRDRLPVLIDFGVVKAGVSQLQASGDMPEGTTVGKIGYSPYEQLQTGKAYPNSDLYALAVTVVVLMTGRKPEDLFDQSTMTWRWHQWLPSLSPWFAKLLNKMLSHRPNNRYQSATEVAQALRSLSGLVATSANTPSTSTKIQTYPATKINSKPQPSQLKNYHSAPISSSSNSYGKMVAIGGGIILLLTIAPIILLRSVLPTDHLQTAGKLKNTPAPQDTPATITTATPTPVVVTPVSSPDPEVVMMPEEYLNLVLGQTTSKEGTLKANQTMTYLIPLQQGQHLSTSLTKGGVVMTLLAPNKEVIDFQAKLVQQWQGVVPTNGDYYLQITPLEGVAESNYNLVMTLTNTTSAESPYTNTPLPSP